MGKGVNTPNCNYHFRGNKLQEPSCVGDLGVEFVEFVNRNYVQRIVREANYNFINVNNAFRHINSVTIVKTYVTYT